MTVDTKSGVVHTHEDGTTHQHFSAGFSVGGQVVDDRDGTEEHSHSTFNIITGEKGPSSGPVVKS